MSLGKGAVFNFSIKIKINGNISTGGKQIFVDDAMAKILLSRYFLEVQGKNIVQDILMQENKSATLLEKCQVLQLQVYQTHQI